MVDYFAHRARLPEPGRSCGPGSPGPGASPGFLFLVVGTKIRFRGFVAARNVNMES